MPDDIQRRDAPPFPVFFDGEPEAACHAVIEEFHDGTLVLSVMDLHCRMLNGGAIALTTEAYRRVYGDTSQIPPRRERGEGWGRYVAAWIWMRRRIQAELELDAVRDEVGAPEHPMADGGSGPTTAAPLGADGYPRDWPRCPSCGAAALDGHITCGAAECNEADQRSHGAITPDWNEAD